MHMHIFIVFKLHKDVMQHIQNELPRKEAYMKADCQR